MGQRSRLEKKNIVAGLREITRNEEVKCLERL